MGSQMKSFLCIWVNLLLLVQDFPQISGFNPNGGCPSSKFGPPNIQLPNQEIKPFGGFGQNPVPNFVNGAPGPNFGFPKMGIPNQPGSCSCGKCGTGTCPNSGAQIPSFGGFVKPNDINFGAMNSQAQNEFSKSYDFKKEESAYSYDMNQGNVIGDKNYYGQPEVKFGGAPIPEIKQYPEVKYGVGPVSEGKQFPEVKFSGAPISEIKQFPEVKYGVGPVSEGKQFPGVKFGGAPNPKPQPIEVVASGTQFSAPSADIPIKNLPTSVYSGTAQEEYISDKKEENEEFTEVVTEEGEEYIEVIEEEEEEEVGGGEITDGVATPSFGIAIPTDEIQTSYDIDIKKIFKENGKDNEIVTETKGEKASTEKDKFFILPINLPGSQCPHKKSPSLPSPPPPPPGKKCKGPKKCKGCSKCKKGPKIGKKSSCQKPKPKSCKKGCKCKKCGK